MDYEGEFDRIPDLQEALEFADNPDPQAAVLAPVQGWAQL